MLCLKTISGIDASEKGSKTMNSDNAKITTDAELLPDLGELETKGGKIRNYFAKLKKSPYFYLIYAFLVPFALMYLIYLAMGIHPFGDGSVLVLDLNGQYVSFYESLREFVHGNVSLLYSWSRSLGGEYMGIYAYYIASPLSYIVALFPKDRILEALLLIFLIKTGLCGASMGFYLHKNTKSGKVNHTAIVVFSTLYALCSYAVVHQNNNMWIDALAWLPLLTYGIEQLIKHGKFKLFIVSLAMTLMSNYYIGYMVCIYTAAYFMFYYFAHNEDDRNNPSHEKGHFLKSFTRIAVYSLIAIGISMVIIATAYYSLQFGKNEFSNPNYSLSQQFDILDLLSKFYPSSYDTVRPEGWPFVYCGLITIILIPCYFLSKKYSLRERCASAIFIGFFVLSFIASTIDIMWHGFQRPNWLNYRYSFMLCFFMITLAYKAFTDLRKISKKAILGSGAFWGLVLILLQALDYENIHDIETVWLSLLCIGAYVAILIIGKKSYFKNTVTLILAIVVCLEVYCSGLVNCVDFGDDVIYTKYSSYNDFFEDIRPIVELVQKEDPTFYRMEKTIHRKTNDNLALNIRGLSCSTSTLNKDTIAFLAAMGYCARSHWTKYMGGTPVNDSLLGLKYIISADDLSEYYEEAYTTGDYTAYYNPYYLSIGYGVSDILQDYTFLPDTKNGETDEYSNPFDRMNALITAMLGEDELVQVFVPLEENVPSGSSTSATVKNGSLGYIAGHQKITPSSDNVTCTVNYKFTNPETQELYFYLPSDYQREAKLRVNSSSMGTFYDGENWRIIQFGTQKAGEISLDIELKADVLYVKDDIPMIYYIDREVFDDAMARLAKTQIVLDDEYTETHLTGTLNVTEKTQTILLTIPYDEGWHITVDGEEIEYFEALDSLIGFTVGEGEHQIDIRYMPKAFTLGLSISIVSLVLFIALIILEHYKNKSGRLIGEAVAYDNADGNDAHQISEGNGSLSDQYLESSNIYDIGDIEDGDDTDTEEDTEDTEDAESNIDNNDNTSESEED